MIRKWWDRSNVRHRRLVPMLTAAAVVSAALGGCADTASTDTSENRRQIVDDMAPAILLIDSISALRDEALDIVGRYAESGSDEDLQEAMEALEDTYDELLKLEEQAEQYADAELTEEYLTILEEEDISAQDYLTFMTIPATNLENYSFEIYYLYSDLADLYYGVETQEESFVFNYETQVLNQQYERQYGWYAYVNYWFAEWEDEDLDYVQEQILDHLTSLNTEGLEWDSSRDSIETRINAIIDNIETLTVELEAYVEEEEDALEALKKELEEELEEELEQTQAGQ